MIHSKNVTEQTIKNNIDLGSVEVEFDNYNLSEEIRVNILFKDWVIGKPDYKKQTFTKIYKIK